MKRTKMMVMSLALVGTMAASSLYAENEGTLTRQGTYTRDGKTVNYSSNLSKDEQAASHSAAADSSSGRSLTSGSTAKDGVRTGGLTAKGNEATVNAGGDWDKNTNSGAHGIKVDGADGRSLTSGSTTKDGVRTSGLTAKGNNATISAGGDWNRETRTGTHGVTIDGTDGRSVTIGSSVNNGVRNGGATLKGNNGTLTTGSNYDRNTKSGTRSVTINGANGRSLTSDRSMADGSRKSAATLTGQDGLSISTNKTYTRTDNGLSRTRSITGPDGGTLNRQSSWSRSAGSLQHNFSRSLTR